MTRFDIDGQLARMPSRLLLQGGELVVPVHVELVRDGEGAERLTYRFHASSGVRSSTAGALDQIMRAADAPISRVLAFARRWGPLGLCDSHGLPHAVGAMCKDVLSTGERVEDWRRFARGLRALYQAAALIHRGRIVPADTWFDVRSALWPRANEQLVKAAIACDQALDQRVRLSRELTEYLRLDDLRPEFSWRQNEHPTIELAGVGLTSILVRGLAFAAAKVEGYATCAGCGASFVPTRRPAPGRRAWCPVCRTMGAPAAAASRDYRSRQRKREGRDGPA